MKQVTFKEPVPMIETNYTYAVIKVEEVELKTTGIKLPNVSKTDKLKRFGEVKYTSYADRKLIGKIVEIDPWRTTPIVYNGVNLIELPQHAPIIIVEESELKAEFQRREEQEVKWNEEAKQYEEELNKQGVLKHE